MIPIIGIDASLVGTGISAYLPFANDQLEEIKVTTVSSTTKDGGAASPERWEHIAGGVFRWLYSNVEKPFKVPGGRPGIVLMEGLVLGGAAGNSLIDLAGLRAVLTYGLHARNYILIDHKQKPPAIVKGKKKTFPNPSGRGISPSTLKLFALGKGGGAGTDKDAMVIAAKDRFKSVEFKNNNEADALWLMEMGFIQYVGWTADFGRTSLPAKNISALDTIDWPVV